MVFLFFFVNFEHGNTFENFFIFYVISKKNIRARLPEHL
jgi:hypothetical protein